MAELLFSAHTLLLDGKEDLVRNLKKNATSFITTHKQVCVSPRARLYIKIPLPAPLGSSEEAENRQETCAAVSSSLKGRLGARGTDPLQRCTRDSTFPQTRIANDLTFGIWLHTVKTSTTSTKTTKIPVLFGMPRKMLLTHAYGTISGWLRTQLMEGLPREY